MTKETLVKLLEEIKTVVIGHDESIDQVLVALISGGHILIEGPPGIGKTLLARSLAKVMDLSFSRIQFTPDLMPTDIVGVSILNQKSGDFEFKKGPVFGDLVLADELNRAPARTQAALLEAMQEKQVTVDGTCHRLSECFTVIATQNPFEYEGTYGLPEAQLDRFQMKITLNHPSKEKIRDLLGNTSNSDENQLRIMTSKKTLLEVRREVDSVIVDDNILDYIADIIQATQKLEEFSVGVSPRASLMLLRACKSLAFLHGRTFVIPEDIHQMVVPVLAHRIKLTPEARVDGMTPEKCIGKILKQVKVPR